MLNIELMQTGCVCDNWKPSFLPRLIFNWPTFLKQVSMFLASVRKNQVSTNQNSSNRWCQIVGGTTLCRLLRQGACTLA